MMSMKKALLVVVTFSVTAPVVGMVKKGAEYLVAGVKHDAAPFIGTGALVWAAGLTPYANARVVAINKQAMDALGVDAKASAVHAGVALALHLAPQFGDARLNNFVRLAKVVNPAIFVAGSSRINIVTDKVPAVVPPALVKGLAGLAVVLAAHEAVGFAASKVEAIASTTE